MKILNNKTIQQIIKFLLVSGVASIIQLTLVNLLYFIMDKGSYLPFFVSNMLANIYGYFQNKHSTFKSNSPAWCFAVYVAIIFILILFTTWLQNVVAKFVDTTSLYILAPTLAAAVAGTLQSIIIFPLEKFVLLRDYNKTER